MKERKKCVFVKHRVPYVLSKFAQLTEKQRTATALVI